MAGAVSAFARRKAAQGGSIEASAPVRSITVVTAEVNDEIEASGPPRKKRKKSKTSKPVIEHHDPPVEYLAADNRSDRASEARLEVSEPNHSDQELDFDTSEDEAPSTVTALRLSTFPSKHSIVLSDTDSEWRIKLHHRDRLAIVGQYDLWVRSGAVSILGAVIHASSKLHRVYAPSTHSIPSIKSVPNPYGTGNPPCEISIHSCCSRIRLLKHVAPKFGRIWNGREEASLVKRSFVNMLNSIMDPYKRPLRPLEPPSDWWMTVSSLAARKNATVMVCGPKGAGKSTFCRILANAILSSASVQQRTSKSAPLTDFVAFLDLDPGQPEYSPPGEMSLYRIRSYNMGPPFSHPIDDDQLVDAHHFGHLSPKDDPRHYYECALDLFCLYRNMSENGMLCPLVVNCSGWTQGSGLELLARLVRDLDLTDLVYMSATGPIEVLDMLTELTTTKSVQLHQLTSQISGVTPRSAADLRMMQTMSYFHLDEPERGDLRWNASPLDSHPPVIVRYAGPEPDIFATMVLGEGPSPEFLESVLDGCIVGVVTVDMDLALELGKTSIPHNANGHASDSNVDHAGIGESTTGDGSHFTETMVKDPKFEPLVLCWTKNDIPYLASPHRSTKPLPPEQSSCLGQALIRSIDHKNKSFQLITPISEPIIHTALAKGQKIVLVRGRLDTPTWAYAERFEFERSRRRRLEGTFETEDCYGPDDVRNWAESQPWASVVDGRRTGSGKVRKVRRDIRYKGQSDGPPRG